MATTKPPQGFTDGKTPEAEPDNGNAFDAQVFFYDSPTGSLGRVVIQPEPGKGVVITTRETGSHEVIVDYRC